MTTWSGLVAANIRAELARRQLSQVELAQRLGISEAAMSRRMRGSMTVDDLGRIAEVLDLDPTVLFRTLTSATTPA